MILASTLTTNLAILVLAGFIGFVVISKVPNTLHTPLMSGTNAIHGIVLLGGLLIVGLSGNGAFTTVILVIAIAIPTAAMRLPRTAVVGPESPLSPWMNREKAMM